MIEVGPLLWWLRSRRPCARVVVEPVAEVSWPRASGPRCRLAIDWGLRQRRRLGKTAEAAYAEAEELHRAVDRHAYGTRTLRRDLTLAARGGAAAPSYARWR